MLALFGVAYWFYSSQLFPTVQNSPLTPTSTITPIVTATPQETPNTPTEIPETPVKTYISEDAKIKLTFDTPMYVSEVTVPKDGAFIYISKVAQQGTFSSLEIVYGIPEIEGKGGACSTGLKKMTVLGQTLETCEYKNQLSGGYIKKNGIEYTFYISPEFAKTLSNADYQMYKKIMLTGIAEYK